MLSLSSYYSQQWNRFLSISETLAPSISMRTKLGFTSGVMLLYAPVAEPGFMRKRSSYLYACMQYFLGNLGRLYVQARHRAVIWHLLHQHAP